MIWLIILAPILIFFLWLLLAPVELFIDTTVATIYLRWAGVGYVLLLFEKNEWWLKGRVLFFSKKWKLVELIASKPAKKIKQGSSSGKRIQKISAGKIIHLMKTFRITKWKMALDTGENILNAWLYPLNFIAPTHRRLWINFTGENYLVIIIRNTPARMLHAWINY